MPSFLKKLTDKVATNTETEISDMDARIAVAIADRKSAAAAGDDKGYQEAEARVATLQKKRQRLVDELDGTKAVQAKATSDEERARFNAGRKAVEAHCAKRDAIAAALDDAITKIGQLRLDLYAENAAIRSATPVRMPGHDDPTRDADLDMHINFNISTFALGKPSPIDPEKIKSFKVLVREGSKRILGVIGNPK